MNLQTDSIPQTITHCKPKRQWICVLEIDVMITVGQPSREWVAMLQIEIDFPRFDIHDDTRHLLQIEFIRHRHILILLYQSQTI